MKNIIAILSTGVVIGFALALANAEEPSYGTTNNDQNSVSSYESSETTTESKAIPDSGIKHSSKEAKKTSSCTDSQGNIFEKGSTGYDDCMSARARQQKAGQKPGSDVDQKGRNTGQMPYGRESNAMGPADSYNYGDTATQSPGVAGNDPLDPKFSSGG